MLCFRSRLCGKGFARFASPLRSARALDRAAHSNSLVAVALRGRSVWVAHRVGGLPRFFGSGVWWGSICPYICFPFSVLVAGRWSVRRVVWRRVRLWRFPGAGCPVWRSRVARFGGGCGRLPGRGLARSWSRASVRRQRPARSVVGLLRGAVSPWRSGSSLARSSLSRFPLRWPPVPWRGCRFRVRCRRSGSGRVGRLLLRFFLVSCPACAGFFMSEKPRLKQFSRGRFILAMVPHFAGWATESFSGTQSL